MGFKRLFGFYAALKIRELENSFFDVTNRLNEARKLKNFFLKTEVHKINLSQPIVPSSDRQFFLHAKNTIS